MATAIQRRRGTAVQHSTFTGLVGEITIDTTNNTVVVHDGSTAGGHRLAKYSEITSLGDGDITAVVAGAGLTDGATSGDATINVGAGNGITVNANDVAVNIGYFDVTAGGTGWGANLEPSANNIYSLGSSSNVWKDVYVGPGSLNIGGVTLGVSSGQLQFGGSNVSVAGDSASDETTRGLFSATDSGGDGSFAYDSSTGAFTYTGPSSSEVRAHFSAGTGITLSSGTISSDDSAIDHDSLSNFVADEHVAHSGVTLSAGAGLTGGGTIAASRSFAVGQGDGISVNADDVAVDSTVVRTSGTQTIGGAKTFSDDTIFSGNLTVNGTQTILNTETLTVDDNIIVLNNNEAGTPSADAGIEVERGLSTNVKLQWDESADVWQFTNDGSTFYSIPTTTNIENAISVSDAGGDGSLTKSGGTITYTGPSQSEANSRIENYLSVTDAGGDGSLSYSGGVFTYTGPSAAEVRAHISVTDNGGDGSLSYNSTSGVISYAGPSASEARAHFSVTDNGGDGSLSYSNSTGVFSFTGPSASEVRAHFSGGTGITLSSGTISVTAGSIGATQLESTTVSAGVYGDADSVSQITVDADGRITGASNVSIAIVAAQVSGLASSATTDTTSASNISSGTLASARLPDLTVADFAGAAIQTGSESFSDSDTVLMTAAAVQDKILSYGYSTTTGDITNVAVSGTGLSGGGSSGAVTITSNATSANTAGTIVARDGSGNFSAGTITATATQAQYADLAEKYEADAEYDPGTVVVFGGEKEIKACDIQGSHAVVGVISTDPAYMMNSEAEGQYVALTGRVPCKVVGPVAKGDLLVSSSELGHAEANNDAKAGTIIGKAIGENPEGNGPAIIEVLVSLM